MKTNLQSYIITVLLQNHRQSNPASVILQFYTAQPPVVIVINLEAFKKLHFSISRFSKKIASKFFPWSRTNNENLLLLLW